MEKTIEIASALKGGYAEKDGPFLEKKDDPFLGKATDSLDRTDVEGPEIMPLPLGGEFSISRRSSAVSLPGAYRSMGGSLQRMGRPVYPTEQDDDNEDNSPPAVEDQETIHVQSTSLPQALPIPNNTCLPEATPHETPQHIDPEDDTLRRKLAKRRVWMSCAVIILVAVAAAAILIPLTFIPADPAAIHYMQTKQTILEFFGQDYFDNESKEKALHWIVYDDPLQTMLAKEDHLAPLDINSLIQRYILATFYFQTSLKQPWNFCNPPVSTEPDTCYFNHVKNIKDEQIAYRWLSGSHECQWMGISCEQKNVTQIYLGMFLNFLFMLYWSFDQLSNQCVCVKDGGLAAGGAIPAELARLAHLSTLWLSRNGFTGSLPTEVYKLTNLQELILTGNNITGRIPYQLFSMKRLDSMYLYNNQLTGSIPSEVGVFRGRFVGLHNNSLTGSIPKELYSSTDLEVLRLAYNQASFSGRLLHNLSNTVLTLVLKLIDHWDLVSSVGAPNQIE